MLKKKQELQNKPILKRLEQVYCRIQPSEISGVGIFAIRTIPLGTNPFSGSFQAQEAIIVKKDKIPDELLRLLHDQHPTANESEQIVSNWPNQPIWTNYLNYSDIPNIELKINGEWETLRQIEIGEELVEDPKRLYNSDGTQKIFHVHAKQYPNLSFN